MLTDQERIAIAETNIGHTSKALQDIHETLSSIDERVTSIDQKLQRQRGFIAGAMFVGTFLWGSLLFSAKLLWEKIIGSS